MNLRIPGRAAFIPYITAGDPDLGATRLFVETLADCGVDLIELGVPFSDPVADGPTNQAAATRALASGTTLPKILKLISELRAGGLRTPIVLFTYLNPVYRIGYAEFARRAREAGASGALIVDLPPEEATREYLPAMHSEALGTVFLASPTTAPDRLAAIEAASSHFVYYTSRTGVTGVQSSLTKTVGAELDQLRGRITKPVAVGFGISTPEQVRALAPHADGIVVGSALVKIIEALAPAEAARSIKVLTNSLQSALSKEPEAC